MVETSIVGLNGTYRSHAQKRVLFFAQDGVGLGHLRRLSRIAEYLQGEYATLVVTGKREAAWIVSDKSEFIHLPSWHSLGLGDRVHNNRQWLTIDKVHAVAMVRSMCESISQSFNPDCIILDHSLAGSFGELYQLMVRSTAKKYMIMRGTTDTEDVKRFESNSREIIDAFDKIIVTSDERTSDFRPEDSRIPAFSPKTIHMGYVVPQKTDNAHVRTKHLIPVGRPWVVCSAGGGINAERFLSHCIDTAALFPDVFFDVVVGPYGIIDIENIEKKLNCRVRKIVTDLPDMHAACDIAIVNGGYNSLLEAIGGGSRVIVFPNQTYIEGDQFIHTQRLAKYYPIQRLESPQALETTLRSELDFVGKSRATFDLNCNGLENIKKFLDSAL